MSNFLSNTVFSNTDYIVPAATTGAPYWDDFNPSKNYVRILYRPDNAVQARELTQSQTLLQEQIKRFGQGIFTDGSSVVGGEITYQSTKQNITYINLQPTYANTAVVAESFLGTTITDASNTSVAYNSTAYVLATQESTSTTPPTLIVKYTTQGVFQSNDTVQVFGSPSIAANVASGLSQGQSSIASINPGIYFFRGFFIQISAQTIILDPYDDAPSLSVGLQFEEAIVDENTDKSLLDPALGASNFQAPGATRYQLNLVLSSRSLTSTDTSTFIELLRIVDGVITKKVSYPIYSNIEKEMARRTYDQAGNFTVKPFIGTPILSPSQRIDGSVVVALNSGNLTGTNTHFTTDLSINSVVTINNQIAIVNAITSDTAATITPVLKSGANNQAVIAYNPNDFAFQLSPGKAYIRGYEFKTPTVTTLNVRRGRDYANVSTYSLNSYLGNLLYVTSIKGIGDIGAMEKFDIHCVQGGAINYTSSALYQNTVIGSAYIRALEYNSASNTSNALTHIYAAYLFDVSIANSTYNLSSANGLAVFYNAGFPTSYNKHMDISGNSKDTGVAPAGNTFITDTGFNSLIFPFPQSTIKPSSINNVDYQFRQISANVTFTAGVASLTLSSPYAFAGAGTLADTQSLDDFTVTIKTLGTLSNATYNIADIVPFTSALSRSIVVSPATTATLNFGVANNFTADILYTTTIAGTAPTCRIKTATLANTLQVAGGGAGVTIAATNTTIFTANAQVQITNANNVVKVPGTPQALYIADVYSVPQVLDFVGLNITQANLASAVDVTARFTLDTGQRDNYYDQANLYLTPGYAPPTGPLLVNLNYYAHSGTSGYLTVDSYPTPTTDTGYAAIPTYKSPTSGAVYVLRDCVDWRPIVQNAVTDGAPKPFLNARIIEPENAFITGFSYYLPRIDKVILDNGGNFSILEGVSSTNPVVPVQKSSDMLLYTLNIPSYTFSPSNVTVQYNDNKRYTMADIGKLEDRIENLEYYTSLNSLEQAAASIQTTNNYTGLTNFQNGILVDPFLGHQIGDVLNPDYNCSIDFQKGVLHAAFTSNNTNFVLNSSAGTNYANAAGTVTMAYTLTPYLTQGQATAMTCVNLFNFTQYIGTLTLLPDNDTWKDINTRPQVVVNLDGENDAWDAIANFLNNSTGFGTRYSDWTQMGSGVSTTSVQQSPSSQTINLDSGAGSATLQGEVTSTVQSTTTQLQQTVTSTQVVPQTITTQIGDLVVDVSVEPYVRARDVVVFSNSLIPLASFYAYIDSIAVLSYFMNPTLLQVDMTTITGSFSANGGIFETVTSTSGGQGTILAQPQFLSVSSNTVWPYVIVANTSGYFNSGDTLTGSMSGITCKILSSVVLSANVSSNNANSLKVNLANTAPTSNTYLIGQTISVAKGTGQGQIRIITGYNGVTQVANISDTWLVNPDTTSVYSLGMPQTTPTGILAGTLHIPNNPSVQLVGGEHTIMFTTNPSVNQSDVASYAQATYYAQGLIETVQGTSVSTRVPTLVSSSTTQEQTSTSSVVTSSEFSPTAVNIVNPTLANPWTPAPGASQTSCSADQVLVSITSSTGLAGSCVAQNTILPGNPAGFFDQPNSIYSSFWGNLADPLTLTPDSGSGTPTSNTGTTATSTPTYGAPGTPAAPQV